MPESPTNFAESVELVRRLQARETADPLINSECHSVLFEHGDAARRAIVFLHGITSSPIQFRDLGARFHARGYNVLIPRMPRHGYTDRLSRDHARLTRAEFVEFVSEAVDIGRGLGKHLTVAGLSVSGVVAAWCAQHRPDVDLAVLIAPAFSPFGVPLLLTPALSRIALRVPNVFIWWDPRQRARLGPACSYPRFSTHAMAQSFLLGADVYSAARRKPPAAAAILAITTRRDPAVNNAATRLVLRRWRAHGAATVREYQFGPELGQLHDIIGPYQPNARVDTVYPVLLDLIDSSRTPG
jgi:pimeloyl-ACP methyl ester carboxylesterase